MYVLGMFVGQQFTKGADQDDLDFFAFPEVDSTVGRRRRRGPDRRLHDGGEPEERGRGEEVPRLPRHARGARAPTSSPTRPSSRSTRAPTPRATAGCRRRPSSSSATPRQISQFLDRDTRPDFAVDGDDPGAAAVHQGAQRHRRAHQEHREPEEVDLHVLSGSDDRAAHRRPPAGHRPGGRPAHVHLRPQEPGAQALGPRPGRRHADDGDPDAVRARPRLVPGDRLGAAVVHQLERHRRRSARSRASASPTTSTSPRTTRRSGRRCGTTWRSGGAVPHRDADRACSSPCCWTRRCGSAASTRRRSTCRWCCRSRWSGSSGS